jgi:hypothetical protein
MCTVVLVCVHKRLDNNTVQHRFDSQVKGFPTSLPSMGDLFSGTYFKEGIPEEKYTVVKTTPSEIIYGHQKAVPTVILVMILVCTTLPSVAKSTGIKGIEIHSLDRGKKSMVNIMYSSPNSV